MTCRVAPSAFPAINLSFPPTQAQFPAETNTASGDANADTSMQS